MRVEYLRHMGDDLAIANAARVSFAKRALTFTENDEGLLWYLASGLTRIEREGLLGEIQSCDNEHWAREIYSRIRSIQTHFAPFAHGMVSLYCETSLACARQLWKSHIGLATQDENLAWSEVSRRYVDSEPEFDLPDVWRRRGENVKQGSSSEACGPVAALTAQVAVDDANEAYRDLLAQGVAPEQARLVLPQATVTAWQWTGSVLAFSRICKLRIDAHAQKETRDVALAIEAQVAPLFPVSWKALMSC